MKMRALRPPHLRSECMSLAVFLCDPPFVFQGALQVKHFLTMIRAAVPVGDTDACALSFKAR